ncbi:MAG: hypothetical protein HYY93_03185 [Planctomycetes bacterium]|nr:hypothetical protein [Planctomycetota bacterium]
MATLLFVCGVPVRAQEEAPGDTGGEDPKDRKDCSIGVDITALKAQTSRWTKHGARIEIVMQWRSWTDAETHSITTTTGIIVQVENTNEDGTTTRENKRLVAGRHEAENLPPTVTPKDIRGLSTGPRSTTPDSANRSDLEDQVEDDETLMTDLDAGFTVFGEVVGDCSGPGADHDDAMVTADLVIGANGVGSIEWSIDH